jgi:UDP-glucuronate 4-epimerase
MAGTILVTGAAGFIGSNLVEALLRIGINVIGIDNFDPFYDRKVKERNIKDAVSSHCYNFEEGDIRNSDFVDSCFKKYRPDYIVHLAAKAGVRPSLARPQEYYDVNVMGTLNLLEKMKINHIQKMIFASSSSVYGNNSKVPFCETDYVDNPISPYAATKRAGELLCYTYYHLYKFDISCLRFFTVYGPRQRPDLAIHKFIKAILNDDIISLYGDGTTSRDYTYIEDIVNGILGAIDKVKGFDIFNLGEAKPVSLIDLVRTIENSMGGNARLEYLPVQEGDVVQTFADITKAKAKIGYNPVIDINTGIKNYIDWIRLNNLN